MTSDLDRSATRSGKYYRTNLDGGRSAYNLLQEPTARDPPATQPPRPHKGKNSPIPPPPLNSDMAAHLKLPTFKGVGDEDMDQFWLVVVTFWTAQNVASDMVKRASCRWPSRTGPWTGIFGTLPRMGAHLFKISRTL